MAHTDIYRLLRDYGPVDGDFVADRLRMGGTETRQYLQAMEKGGIIERRGQLVGLRGDTRWSARASAGARS